MMKKCFWLTLTFWLGFASFLISCQSWTSSGREIITKTAKPGNEVWDSSKPVSEQTPETGLNLPFQTLNLSSNGKNIGKITSMAWLQDESIAFAGSNTVAISRLPQNETGAQSALEFQSLVESSDTTFLTTVPSIEVAAWVNRGTEINFWDTQKTLLAQSIYTSEFPITGLFIHPDGEEIVFSRYSGEVSVVEVATGEEIAHWQPPAWLSNITYSPDGSLIGGVDLANFAAYIFSIDGKIIKQLGWEQSISPTLYGAYFSPDWQKIAWVARNEVQIMEIETGNGIKSLTHEDSVVAITWSPDSTRLGTAAIVSSGNQNQSMVYLWDLNNNSAPIRFAQTNPVACVTFSPAGDKLAVLDNTGNIKLYNVYK